MRLLYKTEHGLAFHEDLITEENRDNHPYAILSHRWYDEGEVLYEDIIRHGSRSASAEQHAADRKARSWAKIHGALRQAIADGYEYIWIDACCIDKNSSAEVSESINSIFWWYKHAQVCYAYLWDLGGDCPSLDDDDCEHDNEKTCQWKSRLVSST